MAPTPHKPNAPFLCADGAEDIVDLTSGSELEETAAVANDLKLTCLRLVKKHQLQMSALSREQLEEFAAALELDKAQNRDLHPALLAPPPSEPVYQPAPSLVLQRAFAEKTNATMSVEMSETRSASKRSESASVQSEHTLRTPAETVQVYRRPSVREREELMDSEMPGFGTEFAETDDLRSKLSLKRATNRLDMFMGIVIALNACTMVISLEFEGTIAARELGLTSGHAWEGYGAVNEVLEHLFTAAYLAELLLRLYDQRLRYFRSCFNNFDFIIVVFTSVELWILSPAFRSTQSQSGGGGNSNSILTLRILRAVKLLRAARLIRAVRLFRGLRQLVTACSSSLVALFWSMVLLMLCIVTAGLMMGNLMQEFIMNADNVYEQRLWIWTHYGTAFQAFWTMFGITFAGNWPIYARPVLDSVSPIFSLFFALYVAVVVFAVTRVIGAIFLKDALDATNADPELKFHTKEAQANSYLQKIDEFFRAIDTTHDGNITRDELEKMLKSQTVLAYLSVLDIEVHEAGPLFSMLDTDRSGTVSYDEFVNGLLRFKGQARSLDLVEMQLAMRGMQNKVDHTLDVIMKMVGGDNWNANLNV